MLPIFAAIIVVLVSTVFLVLPKPKKQDSGNGVAKSDDAQQKTRGESATADSSPSASEEARLWKKADLISFPMSRMELDRARVTLPEAVNKPWKSGFYDSTTCFESDITKLQVVDVLPLWIRTMVATGWSDMAGRYLWTLIRFTQDKNPKIQTKAVLSLYRLGDSNSFAAKQMRRWMEEGSRLTFSSSDLGQSESKDIRAKVLQELDFYHDASFDDTIYKVWSDRRNNEGKDVAAVDYAYYLEKHLRELPLDYWVQRLGSPYGFANALEIAGKKGTAEVTAKLQPLFEDLRAKSGGHSANPGKTAAVASALFRLTGNVQYREYLVEKVQTQINRRSYNDGLSENLQGLAASNDPVALEVVLAAVRQEDPVVRGVAMDALGKTRDPAATEVLFESAMQKAKDGTRFPAEELRALLTQNEPIADSKYEQLKQALLSGKLRWSAVPVDFDALEFFRKHGRQ